MNENFYRLVQILIIILFHGISLVMIVLHPCFTRVFVSLVFFSRFFLVVSCVSRYFRGISCGFFTWPDIVTMVESHIMHCSIHNRKLSVLQHWQVLAPYRLIKFSYGIIQNFETIFQILY